MTCCILKQLCIPGEEYKSLIEKRESTRNDYEKKFTETALVCLLPMLFSVHFHISFELLFPVLAEYLLEFSKCPLSCS